jgi:hypothetical protein
VLGYLPPEAAAQFRRQSGLSLPISGDAGLALFAVLLVVSTVYFVVLSRTFARPRSELSSFATVSTERLGRATVIAMVGGFFVSMAVLVGFAFLFLPGLFLAASFSFFIFAVAVEDRGLVDSLKRSWGLARGSRLKLGVLFLAAAVFGGLIGIISPVLDFAGVPIAAEVVTVLFTAVFFLPFYAILASAYLQLRGEESAADQPMSPTSERL